MLKSWRKLWGEVHNASMAVVVLQTKKKRKKGKRREKGKRKKGKKDTEKKKRKPWVRGIVILQRIKKENTIRAGGSTAIAKCGLD